MSVTILTCTVMVRSELLEKIIEADPYLHESGHFMMGDIQMWVEMSAIAETGYIPESLATYSVSEESATRSQKDRERIEISGIPQRTDAVSEREIQDAGRRPAASTWSSGAMRPLRLAFA